MKHWKLLVATLIVVGFSIFQFCERIDNIEMNQAQVKATLDSFYRMQEQRDLTAIIASYHPSNFAAISNGLDDYAIEKEKLSRLWQKFLGDSGVIKIQRTNEIVNLNFECNVAWVSSINRIEIKWDSQVVALPYFFTAVFHKSGERWLLVQTHISIPPEAPQYATWQTLPAATTKDAASEQISPRSNQN
ncbi:MAG: nuclear transport factor 2 family protein [candidate division KSB1 bacterium]|nr:nuclear transport factor 2 family protein [candidate division KSB1 bacterium]MDZ7319256.1 nuclear transport factor 2 family protein [candidate division KSB1 bacterium]MDZ7341136.1 nuclear transport factor 2 family protein [candidate division KSB1 bacterium]